MQRNILIRDIGKNNTGYTIDITMNKNADMNKVWRSEMRRLAKLKKDGINIVSERRIWSNKLNRTRP